MYKTTLKIDGMMCGMCEVHVNDTVRKIVKAKKITSSHSKGEAVIISEELPDTDAIADELKKIGYELKNYDSVPYEKKGLFGLFSK